MEKKAFQYINNDCQNAILKCRPIDSDSFTSTKQQIPFSYMCTLLRRNLVTYEIYSNTISETKPNCLLLSLNADYIIQVYYANMLFNVIGGDNISEPLQKSLS